jgi:DNA modification methylase
MTIKLFRGNCFSLMAEMPSASVDVVLTSPPYNRKRNDKYNCHNDDIDDYFDFLTKSINECLRVCRGYVFFNIQKNYYNRTDVHRIFGEFSQSIVENIIWHKTNPTPNPHVINSYEYFLVLSRTIKSLKANSTYVKNHFSTPAYSTNPYKSIHRAVMHPDACDYILQNFCNSGDVVFDPFMGVGTTGVQCIKNGMAFIGAELNDEYFEIASERIVG